MSSISISLIHATYQSRGVSQRIRDHWLDAASFPESVEHCFSFQADDEEIREEYRLDSSTQGFSLDGKSKFITTQPASTPSAVRNWNAAASVSTGHILLGIADDLVPEIGWDKKIWEIAKNDLDEIRLWKLQDQRCQDILENLNDDILPRHPAMTRKLYNYYGYFFDPKFVSVGCDNQWLILGLKHGFLRDARDIKLHHATGSILNRSGNLNCGCLGQRENVIRSKSQERIHNSEWGELARIQLTSASPGWRVLADVSLTSQIGTFLLRRCKRDDGRSNFLFFALLKILATREITTHNKFLFIRRFVKRLFL